MPILAIAKDVALIKLKGTVTNLAGQKLENAKVSTSQSKMRALTDSNGEFEVQVTTDDYVIINLLGYEKYSVNVKNGLLQNNTIVLNKWGVINPDKPITVSQGALNFDRVTGSVERITGDELTDVPTNSVYEALAGRLSGVLSYYGETSPEIESFGASIRGLSFGATFQDGVPLTLTENPDEIDDIIIAKDYGSTFLYGGGASSGALIVNSKKGVPGENLMNYRVRTGMRTPTFTPEMMNAQDYARNFNTALVNDGLTPVFSEAAIAAFGDGSNPVRYPNHDYYQELASNTAYYKDVSANFSGGSHIVKYFSHLGYNGTNGIESVGDGRKLDRLRIKNNVEVDFNNFGKISLGIGGSFTLRKAPLLSGNDLFSTMYTYPANALPYMLNDSVFATNTTYGRNLMIELANGSIIEDTRRDGYTRLGFDLALDQITRGLSFNTNISMYVYNNIQKRLDPKVNSATPLYTVDASGAEIMLLKNKVVKQVANAWAKSADRVDRNQYFSASFNYDRTFNENHSLIANLVYSKREANGNTFYQEDREREYNLRANYLFKNKFVFEASLKNTAVRQLEKSQNSRIFYAFGAAWLAHKESLLKNIPWLDYLKVRANYGLMPVPFSNFYFDKTQYISVSSGTFGTVGKTTTTGGYTRLNTGGDNYVFPTKEYLNIGADFQFLNRAVNGQLNYFKTRNTNQLTVPNDVPLLSGYTLSNLNAGLIDSYLPMINYSDNEQNGFDGRISYVRAIGQINFTMDVNAMYLTSFVNKARTYIYPESDRNSIGKAGGRIIGLEADGIFKSQSEINSHIPQLFGIVKPGDIRYKDHNSDGRVDEKDYHQIGNSSKWFYGMNLKVNYSNWTFSVHSDGRLGGETIVMNDINKGINNYSVNMENSWPVSDQLPRLSIYSSTNNSRSSSFWLKKAGYLNIRSMNLSYELSPGLLQKTPVREAIVYIAGKSLLTLSSMKDVYAPSPLKGLTQHPVLNAFELGLSISF